MADATKHPLYLRIGAYRIYGELAALSVRMVLHFNRLVDVNHDPRSTAAGGLPTGSVSVLRSRMHPAEHRRFKDVASSDRATTLEEAGRKKISTPFVMYVVWDQGFLGIYADKESADMARARGQVIIGASDGKVTAHDTMAGAMRDDGQQGGQQAEASPLTGIVGR